jgi:hypothetical protein
MPTGSVLLEPATSPVAARVMEVTYYEFSLASPNCEALSRVLLGFGIIVYA